jgi:hypothetical protein
MIRTRRVDDGNVEGICNGGDRTSAAERIRLGEFCLTLSLFSVIEPSHLPCHSLEITGDGTRVLRDPMRPRGIAVKLVTLVRIAIKARGPGSNDARKVRLVFSHCGSLRAYSRIDALFQALSAYRSVHSRLTDLIHYEADSAGVL